MKNLIGKSAQQRNCLVPRLACLATGALLLAVVLSGCQTAPPPTLATLPPQITNPHQAASGTPANAATNAATSETFTLREGDILKISFPGSPTLNNVQQIRTDGKISLPLIGEVRAAGLTTAELQKKLTDLYAPQLSLKEVTVEVQSSSFPIYVTGAVLRPGRILSDHPITALEAIMEAGGFDYTKANLKSVTVIRQEGNKTRNYTLNLKLAMEGKASKPFYMKPSDIIYVPERFIWF